MEEAGLAQEEQAEEATVVLETETLQAAIQVEVAAELADLILVATVALV
jgi:hypothetical protein